MFGTRSILLPVALAAFALPTVASADDIINFANSGPVGYVASTTYTDPATGLVLTGYNSDTRHGVYAEANLYRRNQVNDHGLGVCSEGQPACDSGGGDVNELDNDGSWEIIALTLPASYEWVSVQVSSLDANTNAGGPAVEMGKLWAATDPTDATTWTLIQNLTGDDINREPTIAIPVANKTSPYLVFEPVNDAGVDTLRNNDFLVYRATIYQPPVYMCPGTGTPGYWKNHPEAWPVEEITIGGVTYTKAEAIAIMKSKNAGDKTWTMFNALVSAKLNGFIGCDCGTISETISAADLWMSFFGPVGSNVGGSSDAWKDGEPLYDTLNAYNNGLDCAPHRD